MPFLGSSLTSCPFNLPCCVLCSSVTKQCVVVASFFRTCSFILSMLLKPWGCTPCVDCSLVLAVVTFSFYKIIFTSHLVTHKGSQISSLLFRGSNFLDNLAFAAFFSSLNQLLFSFCKRLKRSITTVIIT